MYSQKTRGVVIKRMNYGEADRILTIFTERLGKIKALARGVRKITSKMAGNLEPYNLLDLEVREGKTFYTITSAEIAECLDCDRRLSTSSQAVYISEIIDKIFEEGERSPETFDIYSDCLRHLSKSTNNLTLRFYELQILEQAGFRPDLFHCAACKKELEAGNNFINTISADLLCGDCANKNGAAKSINDGEIKLLRTLQSGKIGVCEKIKCQRAYFKTVENILDQLLQNALERELKSKKYLKN